MRIAIQIIIGLVIAFIAAGLGSELYTQFVLKKSLFTHFQWLVASDLISKIMTIGSLLIIPIVYILLNKRMYTITKGVLAGLILLVVISQIL